MPIEKFKGDLTALGDWCKHEYYLALQMHGPLEMRFLEWQRLYDAMPKVPTRVFPWVGASNVEVPLVKTHAATVVSRIEDAYFATEPWCVINTFSEKWRDHCKSLQRWMNEVELVRGNYKTATRHSLYSLAKFGSGFKSVQWKQQLSQVMDGRRKRAIVHHDGPMVYYIHPNNILYPYNTSDVQTARWIAFRTFKPWNELICEFHEGHYSRETIEAIESHGQKLQDPFENYRFQNKDKAVNYDVDLWEIVTMFAFYQDKSFDLPHNLWITFHWPTGVILEAFYNPTIHYNRPLFKADYMIEDGQFWGLGIVGMLEMLQNEMSDVHNYRIDNMFLANTILMAGKKGAFEKFDFHPAAMITTLDDPNKALRFERAGEIYPSITGAEDIANAYAERLTGVGDANIPRLGSFQGAAGVRTPATTTLALIGEGNKRFATAIGNAKDSDNSLLKQFLQLEYQYWARRRAECYEWNQRDAKRIDELFGTLSPKAFARNVAAEVGASTTALNKEAEKQNILILSDKMIQLYTSMIELNNALQQFPQMEPLITKAYDSIIKWGTMLLETFDVRDPEQYFPSRGEIGSASTPAQSQERGDTFGAQFVESALRNANQGAFSNGQRGASAVAASQNQGNGGTRQ